MKTALIDADMLIYQVTAACEESINWGDDIWTLSGDFKFAREVFDREARAWRDGAKCDHLIMCVSGKRDENWRKKILPTYKSHRKSKRKPLLYRPLMDHVFYEYRTHYFPSLEADDLLGLMSGPDTVNVSDDKDMLSLPGPLYRPDKDEFLTISREEADRYHLRQALMGDLTDGYSGCPKVGPVSADRLLDADCSWSTVVRAYEKQGLSEEYALTQARVARILRPGEFNWDTMEVIPWQPE